jgi:hypothetical protein
MHEHRCKNGWNSSLRIIKESIGHRAIAIEDLLILAADYAGWIYGKLPYEYQNICSDYSII